MLISLWSVHQRRDDFGDWALAKALYQRIADRLTGLGTDGDRVRIVLDDRTVAPDDNDDAA